MVTDHGRLGRKNGKGFYDYPAQGTKTLGPVSTRFNRTKLDPDTIDIAELKQRFLVTQAVEAARVIEDGVVTDPREADVGSIIGFGFAPFTGGTLSYIDGMGAANFVALCERLRQKYGERFTPPKILLDMAAVGELLWALREGSEARRMIRSSAIMSCASGQTTVNTGSKSGGQHFKNARKCRYRD